MMSIHLHTHIQRILCQIDIWVVLFYIKCILYISLNHFLFYFANFSFGYFLPDIFLSQHFHHKRLCNIGDDDNTTIITVQVYINHPKCRAAFINYQPDVQPTEFYVVILCENGVALLFESYLIQTKINLAIITFTFYNT